MGNQTPFNHFVRAVNSLSRFVNIIGTCILVLMMMLVVLDVSMRYFFNRPVEGSVELVEFMVAVIVCLGMAYCGVKKGHTTVEFLVAHFSPRKQAIIDSFNELVCTIFFFLITWKSVEQGAVLKEAESITTVLELPLYPFLWVLAIGSGLLCLVFLIQFIGSIAKVK